ncbi:unnamed protein product [Polarella glacialis]|uniref:Uncharacterized protein n=1 Tax=Polarella glacialis TaxID=89957 RepID=A0A813I072_POLGL|nr:unnamed protein product [Polarella glacialis]
MYQLHPLSCWLSNPYLESAGGANAFQQANLNAADSFEKASQVNGTPLVTATAAAVSDHHCIVGLNFRSRRLLICPPRLKLGSCSLQILCLQAELRIWGVD